MGLFSSIGNIVGKFASPILGTIGTAIGGPIGGTIGTSIGGLLGQAGGFVDNNFGAIAGGVGSYFGAQETNAANREIAELTTAANERMAANANVVSRQNVAETNTQNRLIAQDVTQAQLAEAARNRDFQERMSSTAYQRAMADMRAAGLNPILAYQQGGASAPSGSVGQVAQPQVETARAHQASAAQAAPHVSAIQAGLSSAMQIAGFRSELLKRDAETRILNAEADAVEKYGPKGGIISTAERTADTLSKKKDEFVDILGRIKDAAGRAAERLIDQYVGGTARTTAKDDAPAKREPLRIDITGDDVNRARLREQIERFERMSR